MNTFLGKRAVAMLLALVMLLGIVPATGTTRANAATYYDGVAESINALSLPRGEKKTSLSGDISGLWLIASYSTRGNNGISGTVLNPDSPAGWLANGTWTEPANRDHWGYNVDLVTHSGDTLQLTNRNLYTRISGTTSSFSLQMADGKFWHVEQGSGKDFANLVSSDTEDRSYFVTSRGNGTYSVESSIGHIMANTHTFRAHRYNNGNISTDVDCHLRFYKVSEELVELYDALKAAVPYVNNADGQYYEAYHQALIDQLKTSTDRYEDLHGKSWDTVATGEKSAVTADAEQIYELIDRLNMSGSQRTYIDIPIEVLDFRGDGFLFECTTTFSTPYSLSNSSDRVDGMNRPGTQENGTDPSRSDDFCIINLVEDELYDDNVVYKDEVVEYIAKALFAGIDLKMSDFGRMNQAFLEKRKGLPIGSIEETYQDTVDGEKGSVLLWENVNTCYDLAYYMLSSMWRAVPRDDVLGQETRLDGHSMDVHYNLPIPELNRLRLYYVNNPGSGKAEYAFNSFYESAYENGYIYNTSTTKHNIDPSFRPLDGLGYEDPSCFGTNTEGRTPSYNWTSYHKNANYGFSIHAYGGFVYSESANYYFDFSGDDDVYFYINGHKVCDVGGVHGAMSKGIELNDYAAELNLKDGQICSFDMFYAERHTTGINMELYTNIQLMDMDVITGKQQYEAATGKKLVDGSAVNIGTETDYSFSILNRRPFPVQDVSFDDPAIATSLSKGEIRLNGKTALSDLRVTYRSYSSSKDQIYEGVATEASDPTDLMTKIAAFITPDNSNPMENCAISYQFKAGDSLEDLQELLSLGIPADCELMIYGFNRTVNAGLFTNTMNSSCVPLVVQRDENEQPILVPEAPIPGTASCRIYGIDLGTVSVGAPRSYVIDYGKSLEISMAEVQKGVSCDSGMTTEFIGVTMNGENGAVKSEAPNALLGSAVLPSATGERGLFTLTGETLRYDPQRFLDVTEKCYAVYLLRARSNNAPIAYVYVEVQIIPANMVYYEVEDFTNEITLLQKTTEKGAAVEGETKVGWDKDRNFKHDEENAKDAVQDLNPVGREVSHPDYIGDDEVLFFGFGNTEADRARYDSSVYGYQNFDDPTKVDSYWHRRSDKNVSSIVLDNETGTMIIRAKDLNDGPEVPHNDQYPDIYFDTSVNGGTTTPVLSYNPSKAEVFQVRFKMKNLQNGYYYDMNLGRYHTIAAYAIIQYIPEGGSLVSAQFTEGTTIYAETLNNDTYFTLRGYFNSETVENVPSFTSRDKITHIRFFFGGLENFANPREDGTMTVDYLYIGPEEKAPIDTAYGRDSSYNDDALYSNGSSLYVEGNGVRLDGDRDPANYTEAQFTFTGTGFDLISRTGADQAELRVEIYTDPERTPENRVEGDPLSLKGEQEMYQIPVYSVHDLDYGTYYVSIGVNKKISISDFPQIPGLDFSGMTRGNQFYFDALRIYEPMVEDAEAYDAYCNDGEAHPINRELRSILLTAKDFNALTGTADGAVFVDYSKLPDPVVVPKPEETTPDGKEPSTPPITDHITYDIATYSKEGPNNEVYLGQQQIIAFKLMIYSQQLPARIDVGCKTIDGTPAIFRGAVINANGAVSGSIRWTVESSSAQYISLPLWREQFTYGTDENGVPCYYAYIKIENAATKSAEKSDKNVLSITDLKIAYTEEPRPIESGEVMPTADEVPGVKKTTRSEDVELPMDEFDPVRFVVDGSIPTMIEELLEDRFDTACEHIGGPMIVTREPSPTEEGLAEQRCVLCGEVLYQESIQTVEGLKFTGASVTLQSDLSIQFKVLESFFTEQGYADPYVVVVDRNGVETVIREYTVKDGKYSFIYKNIAPHRIGDTITATLYATYNGELYCSAPIEYSVARYCYNMLGKTEGNAAFDKLRTLLVDILHYGAESQRYTGYRTEDLCNSGLTPEQLACGTELTRELVNHRDLEYEVVENPTVHWKGAGLNLQESVAIRFRLEAENYEDLEVRVTLAGQTFKFRSSDFDYRADGTFVHFTYLNAAQLSEPVYITAYRDGVQVSNTLCYSVESYAYSKQSVTTIPYLASLVERMMCYGDSAKAYVG